MGPFLFVYAALVGFFAFAAAYHLILWFSSRREILLGVFSTDCAVRAALSGTLLAVGTATTPEEAYGAIGARVAIGMLAMVTWLWSSSLISGVRARWFLWPVTALFLILFPIHTLVMPLNTPVVSVDQSTMPWGETISSPQLGSPGWWVAPFYLLAAAMGIFGWWCGFRLWAKDRLAGALIMTSACGTLLVFVIELFRSQAKLAMPFVGVVPQVFWVGAMALLIARDRRRTRDQLEASEQRFRGIFDQTFQFIGLMRTDGTLIEANRTALEFAGIRGEDVIGKLFWETPWWSHSPELQDRLRDAVRAAAAGATVRFEASHPQPDGRLAHIDFSVKPIRNDKGQVTLLIPEGRDITERKRAEAELYKTAELLRAVADGTTDAVYVKDRAGRYLLMNEAARRFVEKPLAEILGKDDTALFDAESAQRLMEWDRRVMASGVAGTQETTLTAAGITRTWHGTKGPYRDETGNVVGVIGISRDITERKRMEENLTRSEATLRAFMDALPEPAILFDNEGTILAANEALARNLRKPLGDLVGQEGFQFIPADIAEQRKTMLAQVVRSGKPLLFEDANRGRHFINYLSPVADVDGRVLRVAVFAVNITERKRAEQKLQESEERHRLLMDSVPAYIAYVDTEERYCWVNQAYVQLFQRGRNDIIGMSVRELHGENNYQIMQTYVRKAIQGKTVRYEQRLAESTGGTRVFDVNYAPHANDQGQVLGFFVLRFDLTDERAAQAALRESEARYRTLFDTCADAIFVLDAAGHILSANPAAARMHGYTVDELVAMNARKLKTDAEVELFADRLAQLKAGATLNFESVHRRKDATIFLLEFVATAMRIGDDLVILGIGRDITERKQAEETLRMQARVLESMLEGVSLADEKGVILYTNPGEDAMFGYARGEMIGKHVTELNSYAPAENVRIVGGVIEQLKTRGWWEGKFNNRRKDGTPFLTFARITAIEIRGQPYWVCVQEDITERERAEGILRQSLRDKDALLKEVHHRVKNNLQIVTSLLNLQANRITDQTVLAMFADAQNRIRSMALVHETLYRSDSLGSVSLANYLGSLCDQLFRVYAANPAHIKMTVDIPEAEIDLDRAIPCGLIVNELVCNALKHAFPPGRDGCLRIALDRISDRDYTLTVADDGIGLPAAPDLADNTLGLRLVPDLVRQLGGVLACERANGTTFRITFTSEPPRLD